MKSTAYWEAKSRNARQKLKHTQLVLHILDSRYRRGMRKLRLWARTGEVGERVRIRNRLYFARRAKLERRKAMWLNHLLYYSERLGALQNFNRFDRARRQPPI